ncbi:MAG TPA: hypothetical protein VF174_01260 [Micromonosporaceae bacterium]
MAERTRDDRAVGDDPELILGRQFGLRGQRAPAEPALLPMPHRWRWVLATVGVSLLLLAVLFRLPGDRDVPPPFDRPILLRLPYRIMAGLAEVVTTGTGPGLPARLSVLLLVLVLLFTVSRWRRAHLAAGPGPVDVQEFEDGTGGGNPPRVQLRSLFRKQLSETRLYPPSTGRAPTAPTDFMDVLTTRPAPSNWLGAILSGLGILTWLWPRIAYQVNVTLLRREQKPEYGTTVTVTSLAQGDRSAMTTLWGRSWEDVTCHAGYWVMSVILPVTRLCRIPPWWTWRGRNLPVGLFQAYNEGRHHHDQRQFDLALWCYGEALRLDPLNLELRLLVADVLEELGLYLEALDVYNGAMICLDENRGGCDPARRWSQDWCRRLLRSMADRMWCRWEQRPDLKLRYRYANILAFSERSVHEWFVDDARGERARSRKQMKERLRERLVARYQELASPFNELNAWLGRMLDGECPRSDRSCRVPHLAVALIFRLAAMRELDILYQALPVFPRLRRLGRARSAELTGRSLRILRDVWAPLRISQALGEWQDAERKSHHEEPDVRSQDVLDLLGTRSRRFRRCQPLLWTRGVAAGPPAVKDVTDAVRRAVGGRFQQFIRPMAFADHYNAACVYSLAIAWGRGDPESESDRLARYAVWHLRAALAAVESATALSLRDWILSGDLDLAPLRHRLEFRQFERDVFPRSGPIAPRPKYPFDVSSRAYVQQLIRRAAKLLEQQWHDNTRRIGNIHELADWLVLDVQLWRKLQHLAEDGAWYWRDRAVFIQLVEKAVDPVMVASANFPPAYPQFEEVALKGEEKVIEEETVDFREGRARPSQPDEMEILADTHRQRIDWMLKHLMKQLADWNAEMGGTFQSVLEDLDRIGQNPDGRDLREICIERAAGWQRVSEHMRRLPLDIEPVPQPEEPLRP